MFYTQFNRPTFQAEWTDANRDLQILPPTFLEKIGRIAWNVFSIAIPIIWLARVIGWGVAALAKRATLPSASHFSPQQLQEIRDVFNSHCYGPITRENQAFRNAYEVERHNIITPDNQRLSAIHFRHRNANSQTPTILYFQPNLALAEHFIHSWLLEEALQRNVVCNFVVYDARGTAFSEGTLNRPEDLILDGEAAYQFVNRNLGVEPHQIRFYGWSLGGCISAHVSARHPECQAPYINERSFSSTCDVVSAWAQGIRRLFFWFPYAMDWVGWNLKSPIERVHRPTMIVYHPEDDTIPYSASCHQLAVRTRSVFESVLLRANHRLRQLGVFGFPIYHHTHPLKDYRVQGHGDRPADQLIADFILQENSQIVVNDSSSGSAQLRQQPVE